MFLKLRIVIFECLCVDNVCVCVCVCVCVSRSVMSDSVAPWTTRLRYPRDSLGKSTGVGCHFLLQGNLPDPGIKPTFPARKVDSLVSEPPGKPLSFQIL